MTIIEGVLANAPGGACGSDNVWHLVVFLSRYTQTIERAAHWMFELYNKTWRDDDQPELTQTQLARRLRLTAVQVGQGDRTTAYFNVGDLFGDHGVQARPGPRGNIREILL